MRLWRWKRSGCTRRHLGLAALAAGGLAVLLLLAFVIAAATAQRDFAPVHDPLPSELQAFIDQTPAYRRPEESTYLTFPEWYLVFNPQEYGRFLRDHPPSGFPYFRSIGQFWKGYAQVSGIAGRHYPFNAGNHLMVFVIGASSTVEYLIKGGYENTVGRVSEWLGAGAVTAEDAYAAQVAQDYGDFIPTKPWFEFPYGRKFAGLWRTTGFFGPHFLRKGERKFFLSVEYGVKFLYAGVIRLASHSVYGVADTEIHASLRNAPETVLADPRVRQVRRFSDGSWSVMLPHYQEFTDTVPALAAQGVDFIEVAGNDEILVTLIAPRGWSYDLSAGRVLFTMSLLNDPGLQRLALQVPVRALGSLLRESARRQVKVEHLFDY